MELLFLAAALGLIPATIAANKGRSFIGWWIYGILLFIIALIHSILIKAADIPVGARQCPWCAEPIKNEAIICKHCGRDAPAPEKKELTPEQEKDVTRTAVGAMVLGGLSFGILIIALAILFE